MQDDNTTQPSASDNGDTSSAASEPVLSLGTNPSLAQTDTPVDSPVSPTTEPVLEETAVTEPADTPAPADDTPADVQPVVSGQSDELESIKASALQELVPIVSELEQGPEDKYRTLMMLIQSSDDQKLIKDAYEAAHNIEDKKAKAEALLNIVNEINYFTGKGEEKSED